MRRALELLAPTSPFVSKGRRFRKEVLRAGTYQHPIEPWDEPLDLSNDDIAAIADSSNKAMAAGIRVWVPITHTRDPRKNRGYVERFEIGPSRERGKLSLFAILDIRNSETADQIRRGEIEDVSVGIDEYGDHRGNQFGLRIEHVALVADPVFAGQDSFVALSRARGKNPGRRVLAYRSPSMKKTSKHRFSIGGATLKPPTVRKRLALSAVARKAAKALGIEIEGKRVRQSDLDALCEAALAKVSEAPARGEPVALKALSRSADDTFAELHAERAARVATMAKDAVKAGKIPAAIEADVVALLSVRHGYSLSAKGEAAGVDVRATMEKVLAAIPEGASLPIGERIKALSIAGGQPSPDAGTFDNKKEIETRLAGLKARGLSK